MWKRKSKKAAAAAAAPEAKSETKTEVPATKEIVVAAKKPVSIDSTVASEFAKQLTTARTLFPDEDAKAVSDPKKLAGRHYCDQCSLPKQSCFNTTCSGSFSFAFTFPMTVGPITQTAMCFAVSPVTSVSSPNAMTGAVTITFSLAIASVNPCCRSSSCQKSCCPCFCIQTSPTMSTLSNGVTVTATSTALSCQTATVMVTLTPPTSGVPTSPFNVPISVFAVPLRCSCQF